MHHDVRNTTRTVTTSAHSPVLRRRTRNHDFFEQTCQDQSVPFLQNYIRIHTNSIKSCKTCLHTRQMLDGTNHITTCTERHFRRHSMRPLRKHLNHNESRIGLNKLQLAHLSTRTTKKHTCHHRQYFIPQTQLVQHQSFAQAQSCSLPSSRFHQFAPTTTRQQWS